MASTKTHSAHQFYKYKDFTIWPNPVITRDPEKHFRFMKELNVRDDDVLLITAFKSGTHWVHEIMSMLLSHTTDYNSKEDLMDVNLERVKPESIESYKSPRILHSHLPLSFNSSKFRKIVYVNRNPKDRHVSSFKFLIGKNVISEESIWTWSYYFKEHVLKDTLLTGWFNFTREMTTAVKENPSQIIQILYEDLLMNPKSEIQRLAEFLEVSHTSEFIDEVVVACKFENLKHHKRDASLPFSKDQISTLFRKGQIGDWKNFFTVSQNEQFNEIYKKEMEGADVKFTFDNKNSVGDEEKT